MEKMAGKADIHFQQGPRPDPGKPKIAVPPKACDCHAHIIGPAQQYPLAANRSYTPPEAHRDEYVRMLASVGLERAIIVQPSFYGTDNRCTYDAIVAAGGSWRGVAVLDTNTPKQEIQRLHDAGFRGVRLNLIYKGGTPLSTLEPLANMVAPFGWHVQILIDGRELAELGPRLRRLPAPIVIDHIGRVPAGLGVPHPGFQTLLSLLQQGNCWAKLSGAYLTSAQLFPFEDVVPMAKALVEVAPQRLVWGSDWPHQSCKTAIPPDASLLDMLATWVPDVKIRNRILVDNAAELYGFSS
jgi:predicted TIM-barrel fold metal-dependent hydrolase